MMLSTLLFLHGLLKKSTVKPFKSRDQARRTNFRWQVFSIYVEKFFTLGKGNHLGVIDATFIFVYDKDICFGRKTR